MSMVVLAMLFLLELEHQADIPLLSCVDVTTLLKSAAEEGYEDEMLRQLEDRHRKRQT